MQKNNIAEVVLKKEVDWGVMAMMIDPASFREAFKKATINEIIKERDKIIREIRRYEKGKIPEDDYMIEPSPETVYTMNNLYLAELCNLIYEKKKEADEYY